MNDNGDGQFDSGCMLQTSIALVPPHQLHACAWVQVKHRIAVTAVIDKMSHGAGRHPMRRVTALKTDAGVEALRQDADLVDGGVTA